MRLANEARTNRARSLRQQDNDAEMLFWTLVRSRGLGGFKFVRQHPIGKYFADFACRSERLVIELDGSQHADSQYDTVRDSFMSQQGWSILRLSNVSVLKEREAVCDTVLAALNRRLDISINAPDVRYIPSMKLAANRTSQHPSSDPSGHLLPASGEKERRH